MNEYWECGKCGRRIEEKPKKNGICNENGCKGRFKHFVICTCGKIVYSPRYDKKYCSSECKNKALNWDGEITLICDFCKTEFKRYKGNLKGNIRNFCSLECKRNYEKTRHITRTCLTCGKIFDVYQSAIDSTNAEGKYCSKECYNKSMVKEDSSSYKGNFSSVKRKYFSRVQFCAMCGTTKRIHIHHIIPYRLTHDNGLDNLIPLCISHHKQFENMSLDFIESLNGNLDIAKDCINAILRPRHRQIMITARNILYEKRKIQITTEKPTYSSKLEV